MLKELKIMEQRKGATRDQVVDNKSTIDLASNPVNHGISKHIERMYHFLRDQVNKGKLNLEYCRSEVQLADILTKLLKNTRFGELKELIGI